MHPWVPEIQVYSNEGPGPFPREDNYEIATNRENTLIKLKHLLKNHWAYFNKLGIMLSWVMRIQVSCVY